jgi:hypothetical protein
MNIQDLADNIAQDAILRGGALPELPEAGTGTGTEAETVMMLNMLADVIVCYMRTRHGIIVMMKHLPPITASAAITAIDQLIGDASQSAIAVLEESGWAPEDGIRRYNDIFNQRLTVQQQPLQDWDEHYQAGQA